jgi:hypothetical protein
MTPNAKSESRSLRRSDRWRWVAAGAASLAVTLFLARLVVPGGFRPGPLAAGWALAVAAAAATRLMNGRAEGRGIPALMLWGAGGPLLRLAVLASVVLVVLVRHPSAAPAFITAVLSSYLLFLGTEIVGLCRPSCGASRP